MKRQIWPANFNAYFKENAAFITSRDMGYQQEIARIEQLSLLAQERNIRDLVGYLRPWNIETEGNWIGREWVRMVAMQALCYLGSQNPTIEAYLKSIVSSGEAEWRSYDSATRDTWRRLTDCSCLADPHADFLRCLNEVLKCITETRESVEAIPFK